MNSQSKDSRMPHEITLREFLRAIKDSHVSLLMVVSLFTILGITYGLVSKRKYEATTVLQPVAQDGAGSHLGGLSSQYGGLASLVGLSLPESGLKAEAVAVLQSELLTERFVVANNLMPILFAGKWDVSTHSWKERNLKRIPTLWMANRYFKNNIRTVVNDKKTGMIDLTIKWTNPQDAAEWANGLVSMTNEYLRSKAITEAERNIAYLQNLVAKTNVVAERRVIYTLMEQQIDKEMIARDRKQYALKVIDPAFAPGKPSIGGPYLWGILGLILGSFVAVLLTFGRLLMAVI